jgi:hypothetical protein
MATAPASQGENDTKIVIFPLVPSLPPALSLQTIIIPQAPILGMAGLSLERHGAGLDPSQPEGIYHIMTLQARG